MTDSDVSPQSSDARPSDATPFISPTPATIPRWFWNAECRAELQELRIPDTFLANRDRRVGAPVPAAQEPPGAPDT